VKRERLDFLADNPFYTKRFAYYVGRRCRQATIKDIAKEFKLHWETIKTLEMQYMRAQLARVGAPGPKAIGIDEISIRKGHTYRIVVSDLMRRRPIWFGGADRKEASMALFYDGLGERKTRGIRLAVMDMCGFLGCLFEDAYSTHQGRPSAPASSAAIRLGQLALPFPPRSPTVFAGSRCPKRPRRRNRRVHPGSSRARAPIPHALAQEAPKPRTVASLTWRCP
jgi:hypothetical protein